MSDPILRIDEGEDPPVPAGWDSVWVNMDPEIGIGGCADWAIADDTEVPQNRGGLRAQDPLTTAIIICLFTDLRRPDWLDAGDGSNDKRGWFGDTFDLDAAAGERPMGSLLWTLQRDAMTSDTLKLVEHYAQDALKTLVDQGAVDHFEVNAEGDSGSGVLKVLIRAFDPTGQTLFRGAFPLQ